MRLLLKKKIVPRIMQLFRGNVNGLRAARQFSKLTPAPLTSGPQVLYSPHTFAMQ
jgi:hypothetical protein